MGGKRSLGRWSERENRESYREREREVEKDRALPLLSSRTVRCAPLSVEGEGSSMPCGVVWFHVSVSSLGTLLYLQWTLPRVAERRWQFVLREERGTHSC